ncbi:MAG: efflux RND transporter permease subunit [Firmicutes bacterium]|nr:efflux RND transporter permease subunit [Bacillota bacterium]
MRSLILNTIKERKVTIFLAVIIAIYGFYSYYMLPRQENPDVSAPIAQIVTIYPGASPADVAKLVTAKIEDEVRELEGFHYVQSQSRNSVSVVFVFLKNDVADADKSWDQLRENLAAIRQDLPDGCAIPEITTDLTETAGMIISLSGDAYTYEQLAAYAEVFKKDLSKIEGVSRFDVVGKLEKEIKVEVEIEKLNQYALSMEDIYNLLRAQNVEIPSGAIKNDTAKITVKTPALYTSLKDIENTILGVSAETGAVTRLSDVAKVYMDLEDGVTKFKQDGKNAVILAGYFQNSKNIVLIGKEVRQKLDEIKTKFPEGVLIDEVSFQPEEVAHSVNNFARNLIVGIVLVIVVVFIGMGVRNAIVVSTAIPLSVLMTFAAMYGFGIKVENMSLTALIMALGILVDNAIVISDAIQFKIDQGMNKITAAVEATTQSAVPIFTSTLTTVIAFLPLLTIPGAVGEFVQSIPQVMIISLIMSFIVALFVTPAMACVFAKPAEHKKYKEGILRSFFDKMLLWGLKWRKSTVFIAFIVLMGSISLIHVLGLAFFPHADKNMIYLDIYAEKVGDLDYTEKITDQVDKILSRQPEITSITTAIGNGLPKFYVSTLPPVPAENYAQVMLRVDLHKGGRFELNEELLTHLQEQFDREISGGTVTAKLLEYAYPEAPVEMRVSGEDMHRLTEISEQLQAELRALEGTINVRDDASDKTFEYIVNVDSDIATNLGLLKYDIQRQINIALYGAKASVFRRSGSEYDIIVKSNIDSIDELENLEIKSSVTGNKVMLKQVADIGLEAQIDNIKKFNKEMCVTISSDVKPGASAVDIENIIEAKLADMDLDGVDVEFNGDRERINDNFGNLGLTAVFAVLAIYVILLIQFNSFMQPVVILMTIPLSVIGSILGLFLFQKPLSFTGLLGMVSLMGIVVKNAILLIEYINHAKREGYSVEDACKHAVHKRFNPIILSAATTVMGLAPLAFTGSELFGPMAIALMCGLIVSTVLTMVVVPVLYCMIEKVVNKFRRPVDHDNAFLHSES